MLTKSINSFNDRPVPTSQEYQRPKIVMPNKKRNDFQAATTTTLSIDDSSIRLFDKQDFEMRSADPPLQKQQSVASLIIRQPKQSTETPTNYQATNVIAPRLDTSKSMNFPAEKKRKLQLQQEANIVVPPYRARL